MVMLQLDHPRILVANQPSPSKRRPQQADVTVTMSAVNAKHHCALQPDARDGVPNNRSAEAVSRSGIVTPPRQLVPKRPWNVTLCTFQSRLYNYSFQQNKDFKIAAQSFLRAFTLFLAFVFVSFSEAR